MYDVRQNCQTCHNEADGGLSLENYVPNLSHSR